MSIFYYKLIGKECIVIEADVAKIENGSALCIVTYRMGVHWSLKAAKEFENRVTIVDLRSLVPLDEDLIYSTVREHGRCLVVTEDTISNSSAQSFAAQVQENCWTSPDAPA